MKLYLVLLLIGLVVQPTRTASAAPDAPFIGTTPNAWAWWCSADQCVLLPAESGAGPQERFMLVSQSASVPGDGWFLNHEEPTAHPLVTGWVGAEGDGEVVWAGQITAAARGWDAEIGTGAGRRCLVAKAGGWTIGAVSPLGRWREDASVYNVVLRGGGNQ